MSQTNHKKKKGLQSYPSFGHEEDEEEEIDSKSETVSTKNLFMVLSFFCFLDFDRLLMFEEIQTYVLFFIFVA